MAEQRQRARTPERVEEVAEPSLKAAKSLDYDAILDRIDAVLSSDAEEYVRSFVQKGGQ